MPKLIFILQKHTAQSEGKKMQSNHSSNVSYWWKTLPSVLKLIPILNKLKTLKQCLQAKREKDIRWQRTSVRNACGKTAIRRNWDNVSQPRRKLPPADFFLQKRNDENLRFTHGISSRSSLRKFFRLIAAITGHWQAANRPETPTPRLRIFFDAKFLRILF